MDDEAFFIDREGNKIYSETIASHTGLVNLIFKQNKQLVKDYEASKRNDKIDFLVLDKGYLKVSNMGYYRTVVYSSSRLSEKQRNLLEYYNEEGYKLDDLEIRRLMQEREKNK